MNLNNAAFICDEYWTTCKVVYTDSLNNNSNKAYTFAIPREQARALQNKFAYVLVPGKSNIALGEIVEIHEEPQYDVSSTTDLKAITAFVDDSLLVVGAERHAAILKGLQEKQRKSVREQVLNSFGLQNVQVLLGEKKKC
jgi:hypothetical protein